jgi:hypothetical protein
MAQLVTRAEFARLQGWSKAYITKLSAQDKLVFVEDDDGVQKIDAEATIRKMAKRASPSGRPAEQVRDQEEQDDRRRQDFYKAEMMRLDLEERTGRLFDAEQITMVIAGAVAKFATALERLKPEIAAELPGFIGDDEGLEQFLTLKFGDLQDNLTREFKQSMGH